jgi:hypothetical protein
MTSAHCDCWRITTAGSDSRSVVIDRSSKQHGLIQQQLPCRFYCAVYKLCGKDVLQGDLALHNQHGKESSNCSASLAVSCLYPHLQQRCIHRAAVHASQLHES